MKNGWESKALSEVAAVTSGNSAPQGDEFFEEGLFPFVRTSDVGQVRVGEISDSRDHLNEKGILGMRLSKKGSILIPKSGASTFLDHRAILKVDAYVSSHLASVFANETVIDNRYLFYFLTTIKAKELIPDASYPSLRISDIEGICVSLPSSLEEQRRIVAILDEAFAAIDKAKANTEKNIQNARELFDSYLNNIFSNPGPDWEKKRVGEIAKHSLGKMLDKRKNQGTLKKYLRNQSVRWFEFDLSDITEMRFLESETEKYTAIKGDVLICEGGYPGRAAIWQDDEPIFFQKAVHRVRFHNPLHNRWLVYFLYMSDRNGNLRKNFTGAGIQHFTAEALGRFELPIAPDGSMSAYLSTFEDLMSESKNFEQVFVRKMNSLDELEKAVLQKAFSGELTAASSNVIAFPQNFAGITATDLHAGIIATAFRLHEQKGKLLHFHHVKAEKIAHMAESFIGIDLERDPTKMAAGPNDFPRMHKVEHRAKMANYFHVEKKGDVYSYSSGKNIDSIISKTKDALGDKYTELEELLEKMIPMDTKQAEILATTFAAWNNLLIDGLNPTDEEIVFESRENWHKDKLKIPLERFFGAIKWMRDENIIPQGHGKRVDHPK